MVWKSSAVCSKNRQIATPFHIPQVIPLILISKQPHVACYFFSSISGQYYCPPIFPFEISSSRGLDFQSSILVFLLAFGRFSPVSVQSWRIEKRRPVYIASMCARSHPPVLLAGLTPRAILCVHLRMAPTFVCFQQFHSGHHVNISSSYYSMRLVCK